MTFVSMQHMPLSSAYLCEDCHCIGNCAEQCPACASTALMCLAGILNRELPAEQLAAESLAAQNVPVCYAIQPHAASVATALAA